MSTYWTVLTMLLKKKAHIWRPSRSMRQDTNCQSQQLFLISKYEKFFGKNNLALIMRSLLKGIHILKGWSNRIFLEAIQKIEKRCFKCLELKGFYTKKIFFLVKTRYVSCNPRIYGTSAQLNYHHPLVRVYACTCRCYSFLIMISTPYLCSPLLFSEQ